MAAEQPMRGGKSLSVSLLSAPHFLRLARARRVGAFHGVAGLFACFPRPFLVLQDGAIASPTSSLSVQRVILRPAVSCKYSVCCFSSSGSDLYMCVSILARVDGDTNASSKYATIFAYVV